MAQKLSVPPTQRGRPQAEGKLLAQLHQKPVLSPGRSPQFGDLAQERLESLRPPERRGAPRPDWSQLQARALDAALAAWNQAYKAPSVYGLPSVAGVNAYRSVLSEPESVIRDRLRAALMLLRYQSERMS